jgi:hypothetical protein
MDGTMMRKLANILGLAVVVMGVNVAAGDFVPHDTAGGNPPQIGKFHGHPAASGQKLNYDSLFSAATLLQESPEAQALVNNVMLKYGGRSVLKELTSLELEYVPEDSQDSLASITKLWSANRRLKNSRTGTSNPKTRLLNGQECWMIIDNKLQASPASRYNAELYSYLVLGMPMAIETEPFAEIKIGSRENDSLEYLYLYKTDSLMIVLGIDGQDHLIKSCEGIVFGEENRTVFKNLFSDFREVQGYLFPHRIENISMGMAMGALILENVGINPALPDDLFRPKKPIGMPTSH